MATSNPFDLSGGATAAASAAASTTTNPAAGNSAKNPYSSAEILNYAVDKGYVTDKGEAKNPWAIYTEARQKGVTGSQLDQAMGWTAGTADKWVSDNKLEVLGATAAPAAPTTPAPSPPAPAASAPPPASQTATASGANSTNTATSSNSAGGATTPGIIEQAMQQTATVKPQTATTQTVDLNTLRQATAGTATAPIWTVDDKQTVQHHLNNILAQNGPLMQRAAAIANMESNRRGLVNSSLGVQAGQLAMIDRAAPIAGTDAGTYAKAAQTNAEMALQASLENARNQTSTSQFNAGQWNETSRFNAGETNTTSRFNTSQVNDANRFNAGETNTTSRFNREQEGIDRRFDIDQKGINERFKTEQEGVNRRFDIDQAGINQRFAASEANKFELQDRDFQSQRALQRAGFVHSAEMKGLDQVFEREMKNADLGSRERLAALDNQVKLQVAQFEANYKTTMQASASMAQTYQQYINSVTEVILNNDLDGDSKSAMLEQLGKSYNGAFQMQQAITGLDLGSILDLGLVGGSFAGSGSSPGADTPGAGTTDGTTQSNGTSAGQGGPGGMDGDGGRSDGDGGWGLGFGGYGYGYGGDGGGWGSGGDGGEGD